MMRVGGMTAANKAGLRGDKTQMRLVAAALRFGQCENAFVDLGR